MRWTLAALCLVGCANSPDYALYDIVEPSTGGMGGAPGAPSDGGASDPGTTTGGADPGVSGGTGGVSTGGSGGSAASGGIGGQSTSTGGVATGGSDTGGEPSEPEPAWSWSRDFDGLWNAPGAFVAMPDGSIELSFRVECQGGTYHHASVTSGELPNGYSGELLLEPTSHGQWEIMNCADQRVAQLLVRRRIRVSGSGVDTSEAIQAAIPLGHDLRIESIRLVVDDLSWSVPEGEGSGVYLIERYRWETYD